MGAQEKPVRIPARPLPLAAGDTYTTDPGRRRSWLSRIFLTPRFMFYPQVFWIVWRNGRMAARGMYDADDWVNGSIQILGALENVGIRISITGMNSLRTFSGPAVFIANHMSTLETFLLPSVIQPVKPTTFVVKRALVEMPVFGHVMRSRDPIVVGRSNPREDLRTVLEEGKEKLEAGTSLVIFPQSTRSISFQPENFNSLGVKLAARANVPVVPIALKTDAWGVGRIVRDLGPLDLSKKVRFAFGDPMRVTPPGNEEHRRIVQFIKDRLEEWSDEDRNRHPE